jgi:Bacteriophage protein of unknown function (DUF646).
MAYIDLTIDVTGDRNILRNLESMPAQVRAILIDKMEPLVEGLAAQVSSNIATRLKRKTGRLEESVLFDVQQGDGGSVIAKVWIDSRTAPHAKAQEQGAVIPPHMIYPKMARVLSWMGSGGERQFAERVSHPGAVLAPQWFMRDAYRQYGPRFSTAIKKAVVEGIRERMRSGS